MRRYAPFLVGLLFLVPALACGATTPTPKVSSGGSAPTAVPTAVAARAKIGDTTSLKEYSLVINAAKDNATSTNQFLKPKDGYRWYALDVTITAIAADVAYNPLYAKIKLADNTEATTAFGGVEPGLKSGKLAAGESTRGWLTFEIPTAAQPAQFQYEIVSFGSGGRVVVDLK